jgi:hypothetical protein
VDRFHRSSNPRPLHVAAVVGVVLVCAYGPVLGHLIGQWASDENYSHGFLVIPFSVYLAWQRRARLAAASDAPNLLSLALVGVSAAAFVAGQFGAELFLTRISLVGMTAGAIGWIFGGQRLRVLAVDHSVQRDRGGANRDCHQRAADRRHRRRFDVDRSGRGRGILSRVHRGGALRDGSAGARRRLPSCRTPHRFC